MSERIFERPRIVTWAQLQAAVLPRIQGYAWAIDTLGDLWRMCTPVPNQILRPNPGPAETRIILPRQFAQWWADVCQRQGLDLKPSEVVPRGRSWG